jgi:hypothetical protein
MNGRFPRGTENEPVGTTSKPWARYVVILLGLSSARFGATADVAAFTQPALNAHVSELWGLRERARE